MLRKQVGAAGGVCLLGTAGEKSSATTCSALAESNADVIVFIPCGYGIADILKQLKVTELPGSLRSLPAVRNGDIWVMDAGAYFSRPGPRVIDGAEILAKLLHPELFGEPKTEDAVRVGASLIRFAGFGNGSGHTHI